MTTLTEAEKILNRLSVPYEWVGADIIARGNIDLSDGVMKQLPDFSNVIVEGDFLCDENELTTLKGAPKIVRGTFSCEGNKLSTLEGAPAEVGKSCTCNRNELVTLKGAPRHVGRAFRCQSNQLVSLEGAPETAGSCYFDDNYLTSLQYATPVVEEYFFCSGNKLTSLEGAPQRFKILASDFGNFGSWNDVPFKLKTAPERLADVEAEFARDATELKSPLRVSKPLALRR